MSDTQGLATSRIAKNSKMLQILYQMYYACHLQLNTAFIRSPVRSRNWWGNAGVRGTSRQVFELRRTSAAWFSGMILRLDWVPFGLFLLNWNITMTDDISAFHWLVSVKDFGAHLVIMGRGVKKMHCISSFKHLGKIKKIILIVFLSW